MAEIKVSISCLTYNHADYIRQCLDGFIMQKTDYKFEVLVHDDASTDGTQDIIREYEEKYPDIIKPIYQTENQYSQGINIDHTFQWPRIKGKYVAYCEGDDYWIDEYKLQKQYDAMESHPNCALCVHKTEVIDYNSKSQSVWPNEDKDSIFKYIINNTIKSDDFVKSICFDGDYPFQTSSYFFKSELIKFDGGDIPEFMKIACVGDVPIMLLASCFGDIFVLNEVMSVYRRFASGSWSERRRDSFDMYDAVNDNTVLYFQKFNEYSNYKYNDCINYNVAKMKYFKAIQHSNYKKVFDTELRIYVRSLPLKTQLHLSLLASFPKVAKKLEKDINRFRNGKQ